MLATVTVMAIGVSAALVTVTDPQRYPNYGAGLWWSISTITTVGYGDLVPSSFAGRVIGAGLMFLGIASFALLTALAASTIVVSEVGEEERRLEAEEQRIERVEQAILARLDALEEQLRRSSYAPIDTSDAKPPEV